jgi:peptidoglycan hydrolase CwlO-like protein
MRTVVATFLISLFFCVPVFGQEVPNNPAQDSVTVSVEALRNLKHEFTILENKVEIQDSIITEQTRQIKLYEKRVKQTEEIDQIIKERLKIREERIEMRDERIKRLEEEKTWEQIKRYIWTIGGLAIGFLVGSAG